MTKTIGIVPQSVLCEKMTKNRQCCWLMKSVYRSVAQLSVNVKCSVAVMAGSYSLSKFQKMARPKTAGERNEQQMMDKVGDTDTDNSNNNNIILGTDTDNSNNNNMILGSEAAGAHLGPRGEAPVSLPQPRRQWYPGTRQVGG